MSEADAWRTLFYRSLAPTLFPATVSIVQHGRGAFRATLHVGVLGIIGARSVPAVQLALLPLIEVTLSPLWVAPTIADPARVVAMSEYSILARLNMTHLHRVEMLHNLPDFAPYIIEPGQQFRFDCCEEAASFLRALCKH